MRKIIAHDGEVTITVEHDRNGESARLGIDVGATIDAAIEPRAPAPTGAGPRIVGSLYRFAKGDVLAAHSHDAATLHDIVVLEGRVLVRKTSGDVEAKQGDLIVIAVGEMHSVEALEDAETLHTLVGPG